MKRDFVLFQISFFDKRWTRTRLSLFTNKRISQRIFDFLLMYIYTNNHFIHNNNYWLIYYIDIKCKREQNRDWFLIISSTETIASSESVAAEARTPKTITSETRTAKARTTKARTTESRTMEGFVHWNKKKKSMYIFDEIIESNSYLVHVVYRLASLLCGPP